MAALQELITTVRGLRSEYEVPPSAEIPVELAHVPAQLEAALAVEERSLRRLAGVGSLTRTAGVDGQRAGAHAVLQSGAELFVALTDVIDLDRERARLSEELGRIESLLGSTEKRLSNQQFTERAPAEVVERERGKAESFRDQRERLSRKLAALQ